MQITLPNNGFGVCLMLAMIAMVIIVPFTLVFWLVSLFAPWWVGTPLALAASLFAFVSVVKFKEQTPLQRAEALLRTTGKWKS
jgi:hypothetical protein